MIIGLGYKKNMGKDSFAKGLSKNLYWERQKKVYIKSFSDTLFDAGHILFGWAGAKPAEDYILDYLSKEKPLPGLPGVTPRDIAKKLGNLMREVDPDALVMSVLGTAPDNGVTIITNVRFPNEAKKVRQVGGKLVKITRPGIVTDDSDPFDTALDNWNDWDEEIFNDGNLADLDQKALEFMNKYKKELIPNA